jgi:hypothetical protein
MILRSLAALVLLATGAMAAERSDIDAVTAASLPDAVWSALAQHSGYAVQSGINPFYLQGDFDGDGVRDTAVLVKEKASGKTGVALLFKGGAVRIAGAGKDYGDGDSLDWMDAWYVEPKGKAAQGASDRPPPKLRGDALLAIRTKSGSGLIYWDGKQFCWYQQGD